MTDINSRVGDIVAEDYRKARVFMKYGIDFCCGGGKDLETVCVEKSLDPLEFIMELDDYNRMPVDGPSNFLHTPLDKLVNYILEHHHAYVRQTSADLDNYLDRVVKVHGVHDPELLHIQSYFTRLVNDLKFHMQKEEVLLFPYIKAMVRCHEFGIEPEPAVFGSIRNPIELMESEHAEAGNCLAEIRMLTRDFDPPEHACKTYVITYKLLEEFETNLHKHVHLENNVLFPKAILMESALLPEGMTS